MKIFLFVLVLLFAVNAFSQSWKTTKTTNINVSTAQVVEAFSNSFGTNFLVQKSDGSLIYYVVNPSTGQAINSITLESNGVSLANITGNIYTSYIVYKKNNQVNFKISTNAGTSWSSIANLDLGITSLDIVFFNNVLYLAYGLNNIVYFRKLIYQSWSEPNQVSGTENGFNPRIEITPDGNYIYVVYQTGTSIKSRELNISSNSWNSIQNLSSNLYYHTLAGFGVDENRIYLYYSNVEIDPDWHYVFHSKTINKDGYYVEDEMYEHYNSTSYIQTTTTGDNRIHAAWGFRGVLDYEGYSNYGFDNFSIVPGLIHDYYDVDGIKTYENIDNGFDEYSFTDISSTTNDLFVLWKSPSSSYLKFRQYDTYPANPSNLTMSSYNGHPKLTWSKNPDADLDYYRIYKKKGSGSYTLYATVSASANTEYVDNEEMVVTGPRIANEVDVYYVVTARDLGGLESSYSNSVTTRISVDPPEKQGHNFDKPLTFLLNQNYPNPFNPNTTIEYSIPERQYVSLKIFNSIGKEVCALENEVKEAGNYKVNFNSDVNLPSGIYFYKINAGSFNEVKKMILMK